MQASAYSATPLLDGTRGLIHDLTTIEFNFGGLPIRLRLGLLWFLLLVIGGILLIRSQVLLHSGEGQTPVGAPPPPKETPVVVSIGFPVSSNGTESVALLSELVVPTCTPDFVFNATSGFCDPTEAAKPSLNMTDLQAAPMLPSCPAERIYDQNSKNCAVLLSGGALVNTSTAGLKDVHTLMLEAELYLNIQRNLTLAFWIFLAMFLGFNVVTIGIRCGYACYYLYRYRFRGYNLRGSFVRHWLRILFFFVDTAITTYIITRIMHSGVSIELSQIQKYAYMASAQPLRLILGSLLWWTVGRILLFVHYWFFGGRSRIQERLEYDPRLECDPRLGYVPRLGYDSRLGFDPRLDHDLRLSYDPILGFILPNQTMRDQLWEKIEYLDGKLWLSAQLSSRPHPLRTLPRWKVRGILYIARLFLLLAQALSPKGNDTNYSRIDYDVEVPGDRRYSAPDESMLEHEISRMRTGIEGTLVTEQWIQAIPETAVEHPDKPLEMARYWAEY